VYGMSRYVFYGGFLNQRERSPKLRVIHLFLQKGASELFPIDFNEQYAPIAYTLSLSRAFLFLQVCPLKVLSCIPTYDLQHRAIGSLPRWLFVQPHVEHRRTAISCVSHNACSTKKESSLTICFSARKVVLLQNIHALR
jgi:hypothetical protein